MLKRTMCLVCLMLVTASCAALAGAMAKERMVRTEIMDTEGRKIGMATLTEQKDGVRVVLQVSGLAPGKHGFHIHETGICTPPDFKSAGEHFNPFNKHHGIENRLGSHAGDLPNLEVKKDGTAKITVLAPQLTLGTGPNSLLKEGGTALVIHASPDDNVSDPSGNSGARIACGVIRER